MSGGLEPGASARETRLQTARALDELIEQHETVDWRDVDGITSAEAAAWTERLIKARKATLEVSVDA